MTLQRSLLACAAGVLLAASGASAWAHAHLETSAPAADAAVASPAAVELTFTQKLEPSFSGIDLVGSDGKPAAAGTAAVAPGDAARLVLPVASPLAPGVYEVRWHVLSVDGHKTNGSYRFTVK
ncbi:copper homeostasis periplasmic binding protein CopC [Xylophilus sp.]|uniref:copper homeostasis periplasmic binding protein CopC n=1 Tax=Xylophilus sp. TaxID=2653893 RepID=UPI0013BA1AAF|nr:copper homeostasis periplasmic binding protein CopC [Xylophilus sp.]KAF1042883.1 MAG: Protein YobA [Xylophilus sp.]